jgi:predicted metal-dependent HD superfamily phosphohydrolase
MVSEGETVTSELVTVLGALGATHAAEVVAAARNMYDQPYRHYHRWSHVLDLLNVRTRIIPDVDLVPETVAALLLHDVVYDPRSTDNEEKSVMWAQHALHGVPAERVARICRMIMATKLHVIGEGDDAQTLYLLDLDMSILGSDPQVFDAYDDAVRREYGHVSDAEFVAGRGAFLNAVLKRSSVFLTSEFLYALEAKARRNIHRVLDAKYGGVSA